MLENLQVQSLAGLTSLKRSPYRPLIALTTSKIAIILQQKHSHAIRRQKPHVKPYLANASYKDYIRTSARYESSGVSDRGNTGTGNHFLLLLTSNTRDHGKGTRARTHAAAVSFNSAEPARRSRGSLQAPLRDVSLPIPNALNRDHAAQRKPPLTCDRLPRIFLCIPRCATSSLAQSHP